MSTLTKTSCFQYFSGDVSLLQRKMILEWLEEDADNEQQFYRWLEEWEAEHVQFLPDISAAENKILSRIDNAFIDPAVSIEAVHFEQRPKIRTHKWLVAASVLFILAASLFVFRNDIRYLSYATAFGEVKEFFLPDGSHVVLNANSTLMIPRWGFKESGRDVMLEGEAAFSVIHTTGNQKFIVHTNGILNVEVVGTEFSVYSRNNANKVELQKGSVKLLFSKESEIAPVLMKPGDVASIGKEGNILLKHGQLQAANFIPWKEHRFIFDNTPFRVAMASVEEFFGTKIIMNDTSLNQKNITGSFKAESAEDLLTALAEMFALELKTEGDSIVLKRMN